MVTIGSRLQSPEVDRRIGTRDLCLLALTVQHPVWRVATVTPSATLRMPFHHWNAVAMTVPQYGEPQYSTGSGIADPVAHCRQHCQRLPAHWGSSGRRLGTCSARSLEPVSGHPLLYLRVGSRLSRSILVSRQRRQVGLTTARVSSLWRLVGRRAQWCWPHAP